MFQNKVVVITGGAAGIGKCIAEEFMNAGAKVCVIDKAPGDHYVGDISDKSVLEDFARDVIAKHGHVDILVNNALPIMRGIESCSYEEFQYALAVGVTFAFLDVRIVPAVCFIGVITFVLSMVGIRLGNVFGAKYKSAAELTGGIVLIAMGLKILIEHLR